MKEFSTKSLRIRIYISIFALLLTMGSGMVFVIHRAHIRRSLLAIESLANGLTNFISETVREPLKSHSYYILQEIALGVRDIPKIAFFDICDTEGNSLLADGGTINGKTFAVGEALSIEKGLFISEKEITADGEHLGTVRIAVSTQQYRQEALKGLVELLHTLAAGLILMGLVIAFLMEKCFISPIIDLAQASQAIGDGKFVTIDMKDRRDEIGKLAQVFNRMSRNLESLVHARTAELSNANSLLRHEINRRSILEAQLKEAASIDPLTRIMNRYSFEKNLSEKIKSLRNPLSLIMFDLDKFKDINDQYGHAKGDKVLKNSVDLAKIELDCEDLFCRWGGEEFLIATPLNRKGASEKAERIRTRLCSYKDSNIPTVTASFGVSQLQKGEDIESLFIRVDDQMYQAKRSGKNCVISFDQAEII